jgi:hypothetical protein
MTSNEIGEKIYYGDDSAKVTNVRVTCKHITVPIEKIESVDVNFRIEEFFFSVLVFLSSFAPFLFIGFVPDNARTAFAVSELVLIAASFTWLVMVCKNYVELIVTVGARRLVLLNGHMKKNGYMCKVSDAIGEAMFDEKKYQKLKKTVDFNPAPAFNMSETFRLKLMLDDYEKLKFMKEELLQVKPA